MGRALVELPKNSSATQILSSVYKIVYTKWYAFDIYILITVYSKCLYTNIHIPMLRLPRDAKSMVIRLRKATEYTQFVLLESFYLRFSPLLLLLLEPPKIKLDFFHKPRFRSQNRFDLVFMAPAAIITHFPSSPTTLQPKS